MGTGTPYETPFKLKEPSIVTIAKRGRTLFVKLTGLAGLAMARRTRFMGGATIATTLGMVVLLSFAVVAVQAAVDPIVIKVRVLSIPDRLEAVSI